RLLFCATQGACRHAPFAAYLQRQLDKGLSKTAARVVLGRKLARIAFALITQQQSFNPSTA
ncbi:MAG TPA: IS110 family transposase, partial [Gammaproteobacteria bacterium]